MSRELVKTRRYKAGYEIRYMELSGDDAYGEGTVTRRGAYTPDGHYIGTTKFAHRLVAKRGIKPEPLPGNTAMGSVCSIGFCEQDQKWYGWSHRALFGFGIGDIVAEGDCCASSGYVDEYIAEHPEKDLSLPVGFIAKNLADCKRMAIAFADSVG